MRIKSKSVEACLLSFYATVSSQRRCSRSDSTQLIVATTNEAITQHSASLEEFSTESKERRQQQLAEREQLILYTRWDGGNFPSCWKWQKDVILLLILFIRPVRHRTFPGTSKNLLKQMVHLKNQHLFRDEVNCSVHFLFVCCLLIKLSGHCGPLGWIRPTVGFFSRAGETAWDDCLLYLLDTGEVVHQDHWAWL